MEIIGKDKLQEYAKKHSSARKPLDRWIKTTETITWRNLIELRKTFPATDYIPSDQYCFDIGGNNHRLLTTISFGLGIVKILEIMTHAEYNNRKLNTR